MTDVIHPERIEVEVKKWLLESIELAETIQSINAIEIPLPPDLVGRDAHVVIAKMDQHRAAVDAKFRRFDAKCSLFLITMNKAARWAQKLQKFVPERAALADAFLRQIEPLKNVRDMHEHDDEYKTGGGRKPDQVVRTINAGGVGITMPAFFTGTINGDLLIGGVVSVPTMAQAAAALLHGLSVPAQ